MDLLEGDVSWGNYSKVRIVRNHFGDKMFVGIIMVDMQVCPFQILIPSTILCFGLSIISPPALHQKSVFS